MRIRNLPEPEPDAPAWAWAAYFRDQYRILAEDLADEGLRTREIAKALKLKPSSVLKLLEK